LFRTDLKGQTSFFRRRIFGEVISVDGALVVAEKKKLDRDLFSFPEIRADPINVIIRTRQGQTGLHTDHRMPGGAKTCYLN